ncbi:Protein PhnA [hydrothermal vent metagenome]|uniref:Protein PhnA n=1 Tax=hydrothermal vent metagenome TaxID=652676 RepID=A0A3B0WMR6_9ZZZZ
MSVEEDLKARCDSKCELCSVVESLKVYDVPPKSKSTLENSIYLCKTCIEQIENLESMDANHWRCLNDSMWSQAPVVQVMVWRVLTRLKEEGWSQVLLEMLYLNDETMSWAQATAEGSSEEQIIHFDSNGTVLETGDTVMLIKDLNVKGANFTAKRGTAIRGISLVDDNPEHIEGKVEGQRIVILTKFVKKTS